MTETKETRRRKPVPATPWRKTMEFLTRLAEGISDADRIDVPFLKSIFPEYQEPALRSLMMSIIRLGFLDLRGKPTDALRSLAQCSHRSPAWNRIVREQFVRTYQPVFGGAEVLSVTSDAAREAIESRRDRAGVSDGKAVRFFLAGAEELRQLDPNDRINDRSGGQVEVRIHARKADEPGEPGNGERQISIDSHAPWRLVKSLLDQLGNDGAVPPKLGIGVLRRTLPVAAESPRAAIELSLTLETLGLIDASERPTPELRALLAAQYGSADWVSALRKRLVSVFGALGAEDPGAVDKESLAERIQKRAHCSMARARSAAQFVLAALRDLKAFEPSQRADEKPKGRPATVAPCASWPEIIETLKWLASHSELPARVTQHFLESRSTGKPAAWSEKPVLVALGFLERDGTPTKALRDLSAAPKKSVEWNRILRRQFAQAYQHIFDEGTDISSVDAVSARRAIKDRGGRPDHQLDVAVRFFLDGLRGLWEREREDDAVAPGGLRGGQAGGRLNWEFASDATGRYVRWSKVKKLLRGLAEREALSRVDQTVLLDTLPELKASTRLRYRAAMKSLGLLDGRAHPTHALRELLGLEHDSTEWRLRLRKQISSVFAPALEVRDPGELDDRTAMRRIRERAKCSWRTAEAYLLFLRAALYDTQPDAVREETDRVPTAPHFGSLPYVKWSTFKKLLQLLAQRHSLPETLDSAALGETMPQLQPSSYSRYWNALGSLGLLDRLARPTSALRELFRCEHGSAEWRSRLRTRLAPAFLPVLDIEDSGGLDDSTIAQGIRDRTGCSPKDAWRSVQFLRAALRYTALDSGAPSSDGNSARPNATWSGNVHGEGAQPASARQTATEGTGDGFRSLPYVVWSNFRELLLCLSQLDPLPRELEAAVLHGAMPRLSLSSHDRHRWALRALGFIDRQARPTEALRALLRCKYGTDEWRAFIWERLSAVYRPAFNGQDPSRLDDATVAREIENWTGYSSTQVVQQSLRFLRAAFRDTRPDSAQRTGGEDDQVWGNGDFNDGSGIDESRPVTAWKTSAGETTEGYRSLPYATWSNLKELLGRLAELKPTPEKLDAPLLFGLMPRLAKGTHSHNRSAMRALGLVGRRARPTAAMRTLLQCRHGSGEWRSLLRERLVSTFAPALGVNDPSGLDDATIERKAQEWTGCSPASAERSVQFLRAALKDTRLDATDPTPNAEPTPTPSPSLRPRQGRYAVHKLPLHGRDKPIIVEVPYDLREGEWQWIESHVRSWMALGSGSKVPDQTG